MCLPTTRHQKLYIQIVKEQCHAETRRDETYCSAATFSEIGGARRDRTADLLRARQALSQLSYGPKQVVGLGRFELPTSPLSGVRSNQLSYRPKASLCLNIRTPASRAVAFIR